MREQPQKVIRTVFDEKLAALGQVSGAIVHEINTPLMYVALSLDIVRDLIRSSQSNVPASLAQEVDQHLDRSIAGVERIQSIVLNMRNYLHASQESSLLPQQLKPIQLKKAIESAIQFQSLSSESEIEIEIDIPDSLCILGNEASVGQIFGNLLSNAFDAVESTPHKRVEIFAKEDLQMIRVSVKDSGRGIPTDEALRVFELGFTTKNKGEGTGFGLYLSQQLVEQCQGELSFTSKPGEGSVFTVSLRKALLG
jgi:two-component system, NtrC family, sensor kinase